MIIASLLVRNDEDILQHNIEFHLNNGVDAFVVTEHCANDMVKSILSKFSDHIIERFVVDDDTYNQSIWVTRMARSIAKHKPDWIIHCDADELWCNLKCLNGLEHKICITQYWRNYLPYSLDEFEIHKALKYQDPLKDSIFGPGMQNEKKIIHKPCDKISIKQGNHSIEGNRVTGTNHEPYQTDVIINHYPVRTFKQFKRKALIGGEVYKKYPDKGHGKQWRRWHSDYLNETLMETYMSFIENENWCTDPRSI